MYSYILIYTNINCIYIQKEISYIQIYILFFI